jgi:hypothetical protein
MRPAELADDVGEASCAQAAWEPETLADAACRQGMLGDLCDDLEFMWTRLADHTEG